MSKYEVEIKKAVGTCDSDLFKKMAKRGDLQATKVSSLIDSEITIKGYAGANVKTDEKEFVLFYFDTNEYGLISTGSEIFAESLIEYYDDTKKFRIAEIKTKKGKTYKAIPQLVKNGEETTDDLPF